MFSRAQVRRILQRVPGKQRFGVYRFLPFFFVLGGTMEWIMIKVRVGQETFYDVYRRKASERQYQRRLEDASETERLQSIKFSQLNLTDLLVVQTRTTTSGKLLYFETISWNESSPRQKGHGLSSILNQSLSSFSRIKSQFVKYK